MAIVRFNALKNNKRTIILWGIFNTKTKKLIRTALTRRAARLFAATAVNYSVVKRKIVIGGWKKDDPKNEYTKFWR